MKECKTRNGFTATNSGYVYRFMYNKVRYSVSGKTQSICKQRANEKIEKLKLGIKIDSSKITVKEYYEEWLKNRTGIKRSTRYTYDVIYAPILDKIGSTKVVDLDRRDITSMMKEFSTKYAPSTCNTKLGVLRTLMKSAIADRIIIFNPTDGIDRVKEQKVMGENHKPKPKSVRALTLEEQELFFRYAKNEWYYELMATLINTGMRIGEAGGLNWGDVDFKNDEIRVYKTTAKVGAGTWDLDDTKTANGDRVIPMTASAKAILMAQKKKIMENFGLAYAASDKQVFRSKQTNRRINSYMGLGAINTILSAIDMTKTNPPR